MRVETADRIFTAYETVRQVRSMLRETFPNLGLKALLRKEDERHQIKIHNAFNVSLRDIESVLRNYVGFLEVKHFPRIPLWHRQSSGVSHHYQVDSILYEVGRGEWRKIDVTLEDKSTSAYNWRYWRLSPEDFEKNLRPYLNRWKPQNIELLFRVIVKNELQSSVADNAGISRQGMNDLIKRGLKLYLNANSTPQSVIVQKSGIGKVDKQEKEEKNS